MPKLFEREFRLLVVDRFGDIDPINAFEDEATALAALQQEHPEQDTVVTVEGWAITEYGDRYFKRTGRVIGTPTTNEQRRFLVRDPRWYQPGDEPDFPGRD